MTDLGEARVHYVRVTNGLSVPFTDRYDGVPVTLPPGKSDNIPLDMAAHFFGYHLGVERATMLRHVARRQGWNTPEYVKQNPETHKTLAEDYFDKLKIEPVMYKMVEVVEPDPRRPVPADPEVPGEIRRGPGRPPKPPEAQPGARA